MDSVCLGLGMASAFFTGKGRFLVLFSLCTPHLPLSKRTLGPRLGVRKRVFQSLLWKFWPRDHGQILPLSDISFYGHKMRRTAEVADVLALHFSGFRILWTRMINLCFSTPLSSTLVCGTAMLLLDVQGTEKEESFFFFVLYTRWPWCDGLRGLVTPHSQYYSTFCLKGRKKWIYWLATLTRACVSGLLLCGMIRLQWQGQVKLEQQKTSLTFTWTQGHS